jgi:predicted DNA-binding transcriptional regulator AlpA
MTQRLSVNSMPSHAPKKRQGGASCCISTPWVAPGSDTPMKARRGSTVDESLPDARGQLSLAIDSTTPGTPVKQAARRPLGERPLKRVIVLDEILWMRDVVHLTGKHRCTIHRWIQQGIFPPKNAPRGRPTGWLKSTVERWLLGSPPP